MLLLAVQVGPFSIGKTTTVVNANTRFMRIEITALDETYIVCRDHRHAGFAGEREAGLHTVLLIGTSRPDQLKIIAVGENGPPLGKPLARLILMANGERMPYVAMQPSLQCNQTGTTFRRQPVPADHGFAAHLSFEKGARDQP